VAAEPTCWSDEVGPTRFVTRGQGRVERWRGADLPCSTAPATTGWRRCREDTIDVNDASTTGVTVNLHTHRVTSADLGHDRLAANIEDITGSFYNDDLTGDGGANTTMATSRRRCLWTGRTDTINGGIGDDQLFGGGGDEQRPGQLRASTSSMVGPGTISSTAPASSRASTSPTRTVDNASIDGGMATTPWLVGAGDAISSRRSWR